MSNEEKMYPEELVTQFITVTKSTKYLAEQYLNRNNGELLDAIEDFYANNNSTPSNEEPANKTKKKAPGINTLRDLDDDEEDDKTNTNFFTGGEKSALQVEDPNKKNKNREQSLIDQIFKKAQEQMTQPDDRPSAQHEFEEPKFTGTGFKLGDGTEPSESFADPNRRMQRPQKVTRELTFWKQGFTVGDGPLHRYDDPANEQVLQELNRGRVPVSLLNVEFGQDVDVSVIKKNDEDYQPKRKLGGYHGHGQRLGSPVPGEVLEKEKTPEVQPEVVQEADKPVESSGDSNVQIRFANGKKTSHKFNSTDTILTVYEFVRSHEFNENGRPFNLSHAFPVKPIEDSDEVTVADAQLKNAVIVQRWK